jgi:hypothetical protein
LQTGHFMLYTSNAIRAGGNRKLLQHPAQDLPRNGTLPTMGHTMPHDGRLAWRVYLTERTMDASEFFNTVVKPNYQEFTRRSDDFRLLWNAIVSMNTVAEHVALEQLQYAPVSREVLARTANQIRNNKDLDDLKYCAEALKHVRKIEALKHVRNNIEDVKIFAGGQGSFVTITSSHVSANDRATWTIGSHDLVDVAHRAFKTLSALPELI